jgi:hypothetical protein
VVALKNLSAEAAAGCALRGDFSLERQRFFLSISLSEKLN